MADDIKFEMLSDSIKNINLKAGNAARSAVNQLMMLRNWAIWYYIVARCLGKYLGAYFGSRATHCDAEVYNNLGICLFPQAGVALGMCVQAAALGEQGILIRNITLLAILIYELVGPLLTKRALERAGDITEMPDEVKNRRSHKLSLLNFVPFMSTKH